MKTNSCPYMMLRGPESDSMNASVDMAINSSAIVEILPLAIPNSFVMSNSLDHNDQSHIAAGYPIFSTFRESDNHLVNQLGFMNSTPVLTTMRPNNVGVVLHGCLNHSSSAELDQLAGGIANTSVFQTTPLAPMIDFYENAKDSAFSDSRFQQLETSRTCILHSSSNASNSSFSSSLSCEGDDNLCNANNKWESDRFHSIQQLAREDLERSDFQPMENLNQNGWMSSNTINSKLWNELSLSLATTQSDIIRVSNFSDQYPQLTGDTQPCANNTELGSNLHSCNSRDLSLSYGSGSPVQLSQAIAGSRYFSVIQDILSDIASYPLENSDQVGHSTSPGGFVSSLDDTTCQFGSNGIGSSDSRMNALGKKLSSEAKKSNLLALLQLIDDRYTQCLDEIHTVVSAFHAATDLDPRLHTRYSLQTITAVYRNLREKITKSIFAIGVHSNAMCTKEKEESFEMSFIQKQWALQQLKRKDNQLWRPQRGLPERSVSVLRAWMFQNFLHPYPKDTDKHLLAVKSGLTRNQVSNWFINARVRLWKPLIEEMYAEMSKRKSGRNEEGFERICRSQISISSEES